MIAHLALVLACLWAGPLGSAGMNDFDTLRVKQFQTDIGVGNLPSAGPVVAAAWPSPLDYGVLSSDKWQVGYEDVIRTDGMVLHLWDLASDGGAALSMEIAVSSSGVATARHYLAKSATSTTMVEIPYRHDPAGPGELALVPKSPLVKEMFWIYRNVCFRLRMEEQSPLDLAPLAMALQKRAEKHRLADLSADLPPLPKIKAPDAPVTKGAAFAIDLILPPGTDETQIMLRLTHLSDNLGLTRQEGLHFCFTARDAGTGQLVIVLVDRRKLLEREVPVTVQVVETVVKP